MSRRLADYKDRFVERLLEFLPGALTWLILLSPFILSFKLPFFMAGLVLFLDMYWFYRAIRIALFSFIGYRKMGRAVEVDWAKRLREEDLAVESYGQRYDWEDVYHLLVIPTLKEPLEILEQNLEAIAEQIYPKNKIMVLVGFEEKEGKPAEMKRSRLAEKFGDKFAQLFLTVHPEDYPGHHPGPGSNRTYAVKQVLPELEKMGIDPAQVILTTLDADFVIHPKFLAGMTHKYLSTPKAENRTFTGVFWYYNNFWEAPFPNRLVASGVSFWQLSEMTGSDKYFNFSSHSINLQSLIDMDYWVVDKVNDDGEFFWRAYYHFAGDYEVVPHFLPIFADTVQRETWLGGLKEQYLQLRRWAYGVEHIPMIIKRYFKRADIPFWDKTDKVTFLLQSYLTWSTLAFLITFGGWIVQIVNPRFAQTALAFNLPNLSSLILTIPILCLLFLIYIHEQVAPPRPREWGPFRRVVSFFQWIFTPVVILTFGTFPAIESQTRLMFGKYMEFRVTRKVRQSGSSRG